MDYNALIQNRKSARQFTDQKVTESVCAELESYYRSGCQRLVPDIDTELWIFGDNTRQALEGAAGYNEFLVGAPQYLVLLSGKAEQAYENAGYMMEDLVLKLEDMGLGSCWLTFTDSKAVKDALGIDSPLEVAAIAAFGYPQKARKRMRFNILSMSNVDIGAKRHYFDPKRPVGDMVFLGGWGQTEGRDKYIGFYDDMLWEAFYCASLSPSYLNRQAYGFVVADGQVVLVSRPDEYNTEIDGKLSLGVVMLHFAAAASAWAGKVTWKLGADAKQIELPEGYSVVASCAL